MADKTKAKTQTTEILFDLDRQLRVAAITYSTTRNDQNAEALRAAAMSYADAADTIDEIEL